MDGHELWLAECAKIGYEPQARLYAEGTRTSRDAADQLGCDVEHIAKSIVFAGQEGAIIVITSGANRVERKRKLKRVLGYKPGMATPDYVLESTGYRIGGVPPFGHPKPVTVLMDEDLMQYDIVWGAGGTAQTVFPIAPGDLRTITGAQIADIKQ
ncbi:MAG: YbaK/EbsC family protein [Candidatus Thalassarchaeum sp.]|jgi:prolyl-tRNA editing enzyme YbaK/EbsC (Cys-tRNA(Pro) deacylase)|nr:YbaK/EbsC family protein [Candidatus Thalassarchaeum sp.]MDP7003669.1 YbaK/EbsC family protein [Candidatus Thalassarchaeaceae archaeon]